MTAVLDAGLRKFKTLYTGVIQIQFDKHCIVQTSFHHILSQRLFWMPVFKLYEETFSGSKEPTQKEMASQID